MDFEQQPRALHELVQAMAAPIQDRNEANSPVPDSEVERELSFRPVATRAELSSWIVGWDAVHTQETPHSCACGWSSPDESWQGHVDAAFLADLGSVLPSDTWQEQVSIEGEQPVAPLSWRSNVTRLTEAVQEAHQQVAAAEREIARLWQQVE